MERGPRWHRYFCVSATHTSYCLVSPALNGTSLPHCVEEYFVVIYLQENRSWVLVETAPVPLLFVSPKSARDLFMGRSGLLYGVAPWSKLAAFPLQCQDRSVAVRLPLEHIRS